MQLLFDKFSDFSLTLIAKIHFNCFSGSNSAAPTKMTKGAIFHFNIFFITITRLPVKFHLIKELLYQYVWAYFELIGKNMEIC